MAGVLETEAEVLGGGAAVEGGVVGDDEGDVDGGDDDDHVPQTLQVAVVGEHQLGLLGRCCFVFRQRLVGGEGGVQQPLLEME